MNNTLMAQTIEQTPGYHIGFFGAQYGDPLFDDASPEYAAGWRAYWECRAIAGKAGDATAQIGALKPC
jgi:hypothetical protein